MTIHTGHPFLPEPEDRDQARRFRGRLAAPVTIVTSGDGERRTGLTVSSLFVVEGEPPMVELVIGPNSDLWDVLERTGRFVIHVCSATDAGKAEVFAGLRPNPGGLFVGSDTTQSEWGPVLKALPDRAYCTVDRIEEAGYSGRVTGSIDEIEISELERPLLYFRGRYRSLETRSHEV